MDKLTDFITYYCELSTELLESVQQKFVFRTVAADTILLKKGQVCGELAINLHGAFRLFALDESGKDTTTWLAFEDTLVIEPASFLTRQPSRYYIQALEKSEMAIIKHEDLQQLYTAIPGFQAFGRKLMEEVLVGIMCRATSLLLDTPQQRYDRLLESPMYMQRVPLKYLASFIGITPTSLSRLRGRKRL
ncbi:CRP-like cAMP-binding protein [Chitinophaga niastensis]|uniref:CRP-like cAMP-binding protein n=1 Tax=Chitinophaga niastensis TaxID=536980 RepID=A0A2P8HMU7_CHINA|nr:Crp/Fnr family transcriptional regulator [Chitinophaga niastensis]PSL47517.1 CRP-like cAMP-binding protein [Chitinophaga niastensis]